jgi:hypothetical protein
MQKNKPGQSIACGTRSLRREKGGFFRAAATADMSYAD